MKIINLVETNEIRLSNGTSFHDGKILASYDELTNLFGVSTDGDESKIHCEWVLKVDDVVFTVYDWKELSNPKENSVQKYYWHIGTHTRLNSLKILELFDKLYRGLE